MIVRNRKNSEDFYVQNRLNGQINLIHRFIWPEIKAQTNKNIKWTKFDLTFQVFCLTLNVSKFYFYSWKLVFTSVTLLSRVKTGLNCPGNFIWLTLFFCLNILYKSDIIFLDFWGDVSRTWTQIIIDPDFLGLIARKNIWKNTVVWIFQKWGFY